MADAPESAERLIKAAALAEGFETVGICAPETLTVLPHYERWLGEGRHASMEYMARHVAVKSDPNLILDGVRSVVACAAFYGGTEPPRNGVARYAQGRDYHRVLRARMKPVVATIERLFPEGRTRICVDSAPTLDRWWAHRAGLGWFGKNTMLIDSRRGSFFLIGLVLTDVHLERDAPAIGGCGECRRCVEACPTGAIQFSDERWIVDANDCISYHTIENRADQIPPTHGWTFGCDICQEVCPFNATRESQPLRNPLPQIADLAERREFPGGESMTEQTWDLATRGSATRRATLPMWRRNARAARSERP